MDDRSVRHFLVECYRPEVSTELLIDGASGYLGSWDVAVCCVESTVLPGDRALLLTVSAPSRSAVVDAASAIGLRWDRITDAVVHAGPDAAPIAET